MCFMNVPRKLKQRSSIILFWNCSCKIMFLWAAICCTTYTSVTAPCGCAATLCHAVKRRGSNFLIGAKNDWVRSYYCDWLKHSTVHISPSLRNIKTRLRSLGSSASFWLCTWLVRWVTPDWSGQWIMKNVGRHEPLWCHVRSQITAEIYASNFSLVSPNVTNTFSSWPS
jgi:hypothetical protein